jgi:mannitol/fructose-specific phosphotransferase system IIA component (Ntr-type)
LSITAWLYSVEINIEADAIQVGVVESDWQRVIKLAARPLEAKGFISSSGYCRSPPGYIPSK